MTKTIVVMGTMDTKGPELGYLAQQIAAAGCRAVLMDVGAKAASETAADITAAQVAAGIGEDIKTIRALPQVIVPGAADTIVLPPRDQVPQKFKNRTLNFHNPTMTTMWTTPQENVAIAEFIAAKLNPSKGPVVVMLPLGGLSTIDRPGKIFYDPEANGALFSTLKLKLSSAIEVIEDEHHLDDPEFAIRVGEKMVGLLKR